ncbi:HNH endonuclease [Lonepinella sp. BR2919]|uniref:HNH endonuclease n=1 Tax=unclassified Lonepinella TaxID=2642006 RepID=UPI003F6DA53D
MLEKVGLENTLPKLDGAKEDPEIIDFVKILDEVNQAKEKFEGFSVEDFDLDYDDDLLKKDCLPRGGSWDGEKGDSIYRPNPDMIPDPDGNKGTNPDKLTWGELLNKYGIDGIPFKDGEPDFSKVAVGEVKIDDFTTERSKNFSQADKAMAEKVNSDPEAAQKIGLQPPVTARDIANYRKENNMTWHESKDCKTMQLVPQEIHGNVPHAGGISEMKKQINSETKE